MRFINYFLNIFYTGNANVDRLIDYGFAIFIILLFFVISIPITNLILKLFKVKKDKIKKYKENPFYLPVSIFLKILGAYLAIKFLKLNTTITSIADKAFRISFIILLAKSINNLFNENTKIAKRIKKEVGAKSSQVLSSLINKILKFIVNAIAVIFIAHDLGYDLTGIIAGLGIGSVVFALAAQDTAKNLFGGIVITFDKIFDIGDWIQIGDIEGIVEEITLRSTRVRTFKHSLITVPNSIVASESVINWSKMKKRRIDIELEITYDANLKSLAKFNSDVEAILNMSDKVESDTTRVRFNEISANGYGIFISFYTYLTNYDDYLAIKEKINYKIMQTLNAHKLKLAYPSQEIYLRK